MKTADTSSAPLPKVEPSDRLGAAVPALAPVALDGADLTNVIVLAHRRHLNEIEAPAVSVNDNERPAPVTAGHNRTPWTALIAGVLLLHLALVLIFMREPAPFASLALDSISVEIVLGGRTEAGIAQAPSPEQSAPSAPSSAPVETQPPTEVTETAKSEQPAEKAAPEEPKSQEEEPDRQQTAASEPEPEQQPTEPEPAPARAEREPAPKPAEPEVAATPEKPVETPPPPKPEATQKPRPQSKPTPPSVAASQSGVGVGASRATRDWASLVSAHLARNKRYPRDALALGIGGTAAVAFSLDGSGNVTSIRLVRSSGHASLDRESQDLVRRASPFPAPPQGRASITVPVNFNVRTGR
jgi:protein TonB